MSTESLSATDLPSPEALFSALSSLEAATATSAAGTAVVSATAATPTLPSTRTTATIATTFTSTRDDGQLETVQSTVYRSADSTTSPAADIEPVSPGGSLLSPGAVVAIAICVTLAVLVGLLLTWHFISRHRKKKAGEAAGDDHRHIAEKDSSERSELCGDSKPQEAPDHVVHEMYVPPYEIHGAPIEGPIQSVKLLPDVEYSHISTKSQVEEGYQKSVWSSGESRERQWFRALPFFKKSSRHS